ncbi:hypothetical protein NLG97_g3678 [Lecanicillium saksenae]|uniref:Uncharacterized protein n=1 Tax=Lecanicillium saksenae TaxID=468837 RepID=A0ACC1QXZ1_9HYPO|nr:hypothetical protein NLG97_g3678 [Lecanicillium saksenae]
MDKFPAKGGSSSSSSAQGRKPLLSASCRFLQQYNLGAPPPPYGTTDDVLAPEPLASPSQAWVAAVIDLAQARGILRRY